MWYADDKLDVANLSAVPKLVFALEGEIKMIGLSGQGGKRVAVVAGQAETRRRATERIWRRDWPLTIGSRCRCAAAKEHDKAATKVEKKTWWMDE